MLRRNFGWRCGRSHWLYALAALRRQKPQTVIVQRSRPPLMPDDTRQPRQIHLEAIHSFRYCVETHYALTRIGLEAGPLSQWLYAAMKKAGLAVEPFRDAARARCL